MAKGRESVKAEAAVVQVKGTDNVAKGVIRGAIWGLVLGCAGAVSASLVGPQPAGNTPPAIPQVAAPDAVATTTPDIATPEPVLVEEAAPEIAAPVTTAPTDELTAPMADTTPLALPETTDVATNLDAPALPQPPELPAAAEEPVLPNPQAIAPQVPENEGDLVIETTPTQPVVVTEPEVAQGPAAPDTIIVTEEIPAVSEPATAAPEVVAEQAPAVDEVVEVVTEAAPEDVATATGAEVVPDVAEMAVDVAEPAEVAVAEPSADVAEPAELADAPEADVTPPAAPDLLAEVESDPVAPVTEAPVVTGTEVNDAAEPAEITTEPEIVLTLPEAPETDAPATAPVVVSIIDAPRATLPTGASGVRVNRQFGSDTAAEPVPDAPAEPAPNTDGPALEVYAAAFENPEGKPLMSLLLLDNPDMVEAPRALQEIPFPVTVLVDGSATGAAERMAAFRAAGFEVGAVLRVPEGAQPVDVEVAVEALRSALEQAVVITDLGTADRAGREQMIAAVAEDGRGFISIPKGLETGLRSANPTGVPTIAVYRDLDGEGQEARVIRRFMDQAAFRARQESGVVLLGRIEAETLSALILWGTANRAGQVAMAPVSAVLRDSVR